MIIIFGQDKCQNCKKAKDELDKAGIEYEDKNIDRDFKNRADYSFYAEKFTDLPLIVIDKKAFTMKEAFEKLGIETENSVCKEGVCKL